MDRNLELRVVSQQCRKLLMAHYDTCTRTHSYPQAHTQTRSALFVQLFLEALLRDTQGGHVNELLEPDLATTLTADA